MEEEEELALELAGVVSIQLGPPSPVAAAEGEWGEKDAS